VFVHQLLADVLNLFGGGVRFFRVGTRRVDPRGSQRIGHSRVCSYVDACFVHGALKDVQARLQGDGSEILYGGTICNLGERLAAHGLGTVRATS